MNVQLTPDEQAFVRQAIDEGRLQDEDDDVREALSPWVGRERARAELLAAVYEAEASLARGEGRALPAHQRASSRLAYHWQAPSGASDDLENTASGSRATPADALTVRDVIMLSPGHN